MKFATKMTSGIAAAGAAALAGGLFVVAPGVGAVFTDSDTANANINVGTFSCEFVPTNDSHVHWTNSAHNQVVVNLDDIQSSMPSSSTAPVKVKNTGSMPLIASFTSQKQTGPSEFSGAPVNPVVVPAGGSRNVDLGLQWTELKNHDLGKAASVKYTMTCNETSTITSAWLFDQAGGQASWNGTEVKLVIPQGTTVPGAAGLHLLTAGSSLPSSAPVFTTDNYGAGTPRLSIKLSNGKYARGYPSQSTVSWEIPGNTVANWSDVKDYVSTNNLSVKNVDILADTSRTNYTSDITCVNYSGTPLFGNC